MLEESFLNLQITIILTLGTLIFIFVSFKRRDLIAYLPAYILIPPGYLFVYLQIYSSSFRLLGNFLFLIGVLAFISAIYYEYFKTVKKVHGTTPKNGRNSILLVSLSPFTSLIVGIQIVFSILILIAIAMLIKLFLMKRNTKHATLIVFLISALITAVSTILSSFPLPGMWEFSFVATIIFGTLYLMFPILIFLEEKLVKSKIEVKESEEKYRLISENANDLIAILNDKYEYEYINEQAYLRILGYSKDQLIGKSVWELVHPEDIERIVSSQQLTIDGFQEAEGEDKEEIRIKHKNGNYIWMEYTGKVFVNSKGNPNVIVITRDIRERKKAEDLLRESEEKFRTITEQSFIGVVIEQGFDIKYVNHQFSTILGYNSMELLNWRLPDFYKIVHPDDVERFKKLVDDKGKGMFDKITNFQFKIFKKTGEIIWLELFSRKIMFKDGSANLAFIMNITEKREAEELILEENEKLVELDNLRKELITRISHELRTPLTSMYAASQILLRSNKEDPLEKVLPYIEISHHGSIRLKELIENLLDSSRIENKKFELRYTNENINAIINDCVQELNYLADNRQVTLNVNLTRDIFFKLDKNRFPQVLINILSNALKNTPPNGMVYLYLNETNEYIDIVIKDTGVGLTGEEQKKLFQKFGKIERYGMDLDVDIEGAGLGLYISKEIVELHGGQIIVESEGRHKGSTFIIRLNKGVDKFQ